jgi:Transposase DDE domain
MAFCLFNVKLACYAAYSGMSKKTQRNWSHYNQRLKRHARIELFVSNDMLASWHYQGTRRPGGKVLYSDAVIEACLLVREYFGLGLRQTEGFVQSVLAMLGKPMKAPDYTTLSRRASAVKLSPLARVNGAQGLVIAVDSTGLSVHSRHEWNRLKHARGDYKWHDTWRKLHVAIDTQTGLIISAAYSSASASDSEQFPALLEAVDAPVAAVCADMAYDNVRCRKAIYQRGGRQLIPPKKNACLSHKNRDLKPHTNLLKERDDAIAYIQHNRVNGDASLARASWKKHSGYHAKSRVETTMSQIKTHTSDRLTNRTEANRNTQAILKCILVNKLINA